MKDIDKKYGKHSFDGTPGEPCYCSNGCGCWHGVDGLAGGPIGIDFSSDGVCPYNPADSNLLGGGRDFDVVVEQRIKGLEAALKDAEVRIEGLTRDIGVAVNKIEEVTRYFPI